MKNKKDRVYLLIEDDNNCDLSCRVFATVAGIEDAFAKTLQKHFDDNGYHSSHTDESQCTFAECVKRGSWVEDGYWLSIEEKSLEQ